MMSRALELGWEKWCEEKENSERRQGRDRREGEEDDRPRRPCMPPSLLTPEEEAEQERLMDRMIWGFRR